MTLVDTSVWVDHFRSGNASLGALLTAGLVLTHPFVIGEIACGNLRNRPRVLADLQALPAVTSAEHEEVLSLLQSRKLWGRGLGWIDAHLLASAALTPCSIWTLDKNLHRVATTLGVEMEKKL